MQFSADELSNQKVYKSMSRSFKARASSIEDAEYSSDIFLSDDDKDVTTK
jgi:hypothetical protein